ncbi:hypothetical protein PTI98_012471 [Pleurotus ostreatus]|nr:hypothetical protein PTI98_012471 [Pleurotus ostreatus]
MTHVSLSPSPRPSLPHSKSTGSPSERVGKLRHSQPHTRPSSSSIHYIFRFLKQKKSQPQSPEYTANVPEYFPLVWSAQQLEEGSNHSFI